MVPVLPKVQRNSASRLPFLLDILPRLMNITKQTTPVEIRECLLREYGAEVHLQQCRRAKTEILKQRAAEVEGPQDMGPQQQQPPQGMGGRQNQQSMDGMGREGPNDASQQLFADMNVSPNHSPIRYAAYRTGRGHSCDDGSADSGSEDSGRTACSVSLLHQSPMDEEYQGCGGAHVNACCRVIWRSEGKYLILVFPTHHILRSPRQWNIDPPYALLMKKRWICGFAHRSTIAL